MSHSQFLVAQLKHDAKCDAIKKVFTEMYRNQMRYEPLKYQSFFGLSDDDVADLKTHYDAVDYSGRLVVVNLPNDVDSMAYHKKAIKASSKVYMSEVLVTFELGENGKHPHYNFLFLKNVEWLAKSRIIANFANTFGIAQNYVNVTELTYGDFMYEVDTYIQKENLWKLDKRSKKVIHRNSKK